MHLVKRDELDPRAVNGADRRIEELRRHLEQPVKLEGIAARRPDVMQGQDRPRSADERPQPHVAAREIQRLEPGTDDRLLRRQRRLLAPEYAGNFLAAPLSAAWAKGIRLARAILTRPR